MKGSALTLSSCAMLIAIGVPMAAAALFDTMFVITDINSRKALRIIGVGKPAARSTKPWAR